MIRLVKFILVLILISTHLSCQTMDVRKDMVHFDQVFIPFWLYVYEGNMLQAKGAVFAVEFQWQKLKNHYQNAVSEDDWKEAFRRIDDWLGDAYYAVDDNSRERALNPIEHVRYELTMLRQQYEITYYLDYLFGFQEALTVLRETVEDEMLCLKDWNELERMIGETGNQWKTLQLQPLDTDLFELDAEKVSLFRQYGIEISILLDDLQSVTGDAQREKMAQIVLDLEGVYLQLLQLFGRFDATKQQMAML